MCLQFKNHAYALNELLFNTNTKYFTHKQEIV